MNFLELTPRIGKNYHAADGKKPRRKAEYAAQLATALPFYSRLAPGWSGFLILPGGGLGLNDNSFSAKSRALRLGFAVEGEGGAA